MMPSSAKNRVDLASPPLIVACDFDGTLWRNHSVSREDIAAIRRWEAAGNAFGLVTGRGISTLLEDLALCPPFACDFLICNNGALLCDGFGRKRLCCSIPENDLEALNAEKATSLPLHQVSIAYPDFETALCWTESLRDLAGIEPHPSRICIDITAKDVSKSNGILNMLELFSWKGKVLAIGDDGNDLPMLRAFTGFAMDTAPDSVKEAAEAVFPSVASVLNAYL